jgi:hypothetical protein
MGPARPLTEALLESGFEVTGIDVSSELLALGLKSRAAAPWPSHNKTFGREAIRSPTPEMQ